MMHSYLSSGDLDFFWDEQMNALSWFPRIWHPEGGFGWSGLQSLWLDYPFRLFIKLLNTFGFSWWIIEKLLWISVFVLGICASYRFARYMLRGSGYSFIAPIVYMVNTYVLLLFSGGQLGVALAYSLAPFVLLRFFRSIDARDGIELRVTSNELREYVVNGLVFALLVCFDLRLAYLICILCGLYFLYRISKHGFHLLNLFLIFVVPFGVAFCIHLFWILPVVMVRGGFSVGQDFSNTGMLKFLSVADFSHALSFLHPNWPENLFGKVYFLQPEFLVIPLLAFGSLLFINWTKKTNKTDIVFFALLALIGTFLAKGAQEPFGGVFVWLFERFPGFVMFRDPTKFYVFIALGYSILIPFTIRSISNWIGRKRLTAVVLIFIVFWVFSIRAVFEHQVTGNFRPLTLSHDYVQLKNMLVSDQQPYRTLWLPRSDKFVYTSQTHPVLTGDSLWKNASMSSLLTILSTPSFSKTIAESGVRYIIVQSDLEKRTYLTDYRFDPTIRQQFIQALILSGYQQIGGFENLAVFENGTYTFTSYEPDGVVKQERWAKIGLIMSVCSIGAILVWIVRTRA